MTKPTTDQIDTILKHLPVLKRGGPVASRVYPAKKEKGVVAMGWEEHYHEISGLISDLYKQGFITKFDWPSWQESAVRYVENPKRLKRAVLGTLLKLLTTHVRKDRFCEGHFTAMVENGHLTAILERLAELRHKA
jgi:hypothetical protein